MFSLGTTEILVILVVALLIIGPSKLPEVARTLGKGMAEFRRMSSDVKKTVDLESKLSDMERQEQSKESDAAITDSGGDSDQEAEGRQPPEHGESDGSEDAGADPGEAKRTADRDDSSEPDRG
jgi:sec-independent protein translocase protein TatB